MASLNKVMLIGNLGTDVEIRHLPSGDPVANFSIATTESWKDKKSGEKKEETTWHNIVMFGKPAEIAEKYLCKGSQVYIDGRIKIEKYKAKDGGDRIAIKIIADTMQMLGRKESSSDAPRESRTSVSKHEVNSFSDMDSDIPF